jgi:hypothetical protein
MGPRAGLDNMEQGESLTLSILELRPLGYLACSESLYRLRYPQYLPKIINFNKVLGSEDIFNSRSCSIGRKSELEFHQKK